MGRIGFIRPIGVIGLIGYLVWVGTLFFGLVYLDDNVLVFEKLSYFRDLGNFRALFTSDALAEVGGGFFYRPIAALSYMVNAAVGGGSPFGYHLVNLALHLVAGVLVYWLIRGLLEIGNRKQEIGQEIGEGKDEWVTAFGALIFLVHPVATQAVAWIPGRNEVLLAIFILLSLIGLMGHIGPIGLIGHFIFYALALFTKETAVLVPVLGLTLLITDKTLLNTAKKKVAVLSSYIAVTSSVTLVWFFVRQLVLEHPLTVLTTNTSLLDAAKNMVTVFLGSLGKLVFPFNLSTYPIVGESFLPMGLIGLISLIGLIGLIRRMGSMGRMGVVWVLFFTAASVIRPNIADPQAEVLEHRLYLPLIGLAMVAGNMIQQMRRWAGNRKQEIGKWLGNKKTENGFPISNFFTYFLFPVSIFLFITITLANTRHYRNGTSYWKRAVATSPDSAFAHKQLGVMYYLMKQFDQAQREYEAALAKNPNEPLVHNNIGVILMDRGRLEEAREEFARELEINPGYENAIKNLELIKNKLE